MIDNGLERVLAGKYCIGCGACAVLDQSAYEINLDHEGKYQANQKAIVSEDISSDILSSQVCPFADESLNEDELGKQLYGNVDGIKHDDYLGYYLKNYAGFVSKNGFREKGSSGGMGSWLATTMLREKMVDHVLHVRPSEKSDLLFSYAVSSTEDEIIQGAKSKYYPVEMSEILNHVRNTPGKYLLIGIPCFIKAIRLLSLKEPVFEERILYTLGLVCGHLKTDRFAKTIGWQLGIHPDSLQEIDFRVKLPNKPAGYYGAKVSGEVSNTVVSHTSPMRETIVSNWGHGLFRYNACDYCDDVLAECADITIGDAWLPEYVSDVGGTNVIIVRNPRLARLLTDFKEELTIEEISAEKIYQSQAGGFRHRREGLAYRLFLKDQKHEWHPKKRVAPSDSVTNKRKKIYHGRIPLLDEGNSAYEKAFKANDFTVFEKYMTPVLNSYNKLYHRSFVIRIAGKIIRVARNIITR